MEVGTIGSTEASRSERVQRTTIAFLILVAACLLGRVWVLVEYGSVGNMGDVIVDSKHPVTGESMHHRIVRTADEKDPKVWAAKVVNETLEFNKGLRGN